MQHDPHDQSPYSCTTILFRAITSQYWIKNGEHQPKIFFRRENNDPQGISLFDSIQACKKSMPSGVIYGVRSVHVGRLLDSPSGLGLFPDKHDPSHCNIRFSDGTLTPRLTESPDCRNIGHDLMLVSRPVEYWEAPDADARFAVEIEQKRAAQK
ncbi:MAG TPA: hypothetical protein VI306_12935 [Pyrinomonadaceae bacterium]